MKASKLILATMGIFLSISTQAQKNGRVKTYDSLFHRTAYTYADVMPYFGNDNNDILNYFQRHYRTVDRTDYNGKFKLLILIETDGTVADARIYDKSTSEISENEREALKVIKKMPKWHAGVCYGRKVPMFCRVPIQVCFLD